MEKGPKFAIIKTGGKQYKVRQGERLKIEKLVSKEGKVQFEDIFQGKKVSAKVLAEGKRPKVRVLKFRRRKRYKKVQGHRQLYTEIQIEKIE
ncbi:MAG TPA: 50S ribosomal protein L21 [Patescibacteria group bacterium]|nr:50S ribosomal protein L21 [Patescibacteria group bacterium]